MIMTEKNRNLTFFSPIVYYYSSGNKVRPPEYLCRDSLAIGCFQIMTTSNFDACCFNAVQ